MPLWSRASQFWNGFLFLIVSWPLNGDVCPVFTDFGTDMIPSDSRVEIDAKINAGYFTMGKKYTDEELAQVKGRGWQNWEDVDH